MITVLSWFWRQDGGRIRYSAEHVNIWASMVRRNLSMAHRIACVTDIPDGIDDRIEIIEPPHEFEHVRIPTWRADRPQCLRRLTMFRRDAAKIFGRRFVCMDLDCVISGPLDPLFKTRADFKIYRGTAVGRPYNGSLMLITAGCRPQVYEKFTPDAAVEAGKRFVGSDQAWISHILGPNEQTWGVEDGIFWWNRQQPKAATKDARLMFYPGFVKPWQLLVNGGDEWVSRHYRHAPAGKCLILGYADNVWDEAEVAVESGPFDAVIASPEAAEHWPGEILAVANDDAQAERLARMHGFDEFVFCGRTPRTALQLMGN